MSELSLVEALESRLQADPDDWESWLVYADYLTDQDDAHGEIIRLEHRLAVEKLSRRERRALTEQLEALMTEHQARWLQGWSKLTRSRLTWRRGFITEMHACPLLAVEALTALPVGRFLTRLSLSLDTREEGVQTLLRSRIPRSLRVLELTNSRLGSQAACALAGAQWMSALKTLDLSRNGIGPDGARALATSEHLGALVELDLTDNHLGPGGVSALAATERLPSLRVLKLGSNRLKNRSAIELARAESLASLVTLDLSFNEIGEQGKAALVAFERLRGCQVIL